MKPITILASAALFIVTSAELRAAGKQLSGQHAPATTPPLSPAEAQTKFTLPEGFEARLFASEPDVINPVAMTWDDRGRLWVVELYEYPLGAPAGTKPRDRVKILEDVDGDGHADKVTIFADGLNLATAILLGNGGCYVGQAPDLLFLQDTNHDERRLVSSHQRTSRPGRRAVDWRLVRQISVLSECERRSRRRGPRARAHLEGGLHRKKSRRENWQPAGRKNGFGESNQRRIGEIT